MRIISGKYGRRRFSVPQGLKLRPTTDLAKEALFASLTASIDFEEKEVLDLFTGTGSIGLEFLSRGVQAVSMVDKHPKHIAFVRQVITALGAEKETKTYIKDVRSFLHQLKEEGRVFDIIFADPPYDLPWLAELPQIIFSSPSLLRPDGLFILEHPSTYDFSSMDFFVRHRSYSAVNFSYFSKLSDG